MGLVARFWAVDGSAQGECLHEGAFLIAFMGTSICLEDTEMSETSMEGGIRHIGLPAKG